MFEGRFNLKKRVFFQNQKTTKKNLLFSPILLIPLILVFISSFLIESVQRQSLQSDSYAHFVTGILGYFLALFI